MRTLIIYDSMYVEVSLSHRVPQRHQPENWLIANVFCVWNANWPALPGRLPELCAGAGGAEYVAGGKQRAGRAALGG